MRRQRSLSLSCVAFLILLLCGQAAAAGPGQGAGSLHAHRRGRTGLVRRLAEIDVAPTAARRLAPEIAPSAMAGPRVFATTDTTNGTAAPAVGDDEPPPSVSPPPMSPAPEPSTASPSPPPDTEPPPPPPAVAPSPEPAPVASPSPPPPAPAPVASPPPGESPAPAPAAPPPAANVEVTALMGFKSSITNANSVPNMADWTAGSSSPCAWTGITCDGTSGNVTAIDLTGSGLIGSLSDSITELLSLESMLLGGNFLTGNVPDSWNVDSVLSVLTVLNLTGNRLYGLPTDFGSEGCSNLQTLDLSYNIMNGSLPGALSLGHLSQASFVGNSLTGSLPSWVGPPSTATVAVLPQGSNGYLCGSVPSSPAFTFTDGTTRATLDNSLGSCFVTCSTTTTESLAGTNLFDVAVRSSVTAWDLAVHNDLAGGQGSATQVALPCYGTGSPVGGYFGGDAAYGQLAVTSSGETTPSGVTSHTTTSCYSGGDTVVIDLGASYALGAVVISLGSGSTASEGAVRLSVSMSGASAQSCAGYTSSGTSRTAAADCTGSTGRYVWLTPGSSSAAICGIQVYPLVSDSALAKSASYSQSSGSTGTVTSFTGSSTGISIGGDTPTFVLDLGYTATDVAAVVLTGGNGVESVALSASNPLTVSSRRRRLQMVMDDNDDDRTTAYYYNAAYKSKHTNRRRLLSNTTSPQAAPSQNDVVTTLAASGTACMQSGASTAWLCSGVGGGRYVVVTGSSSLSFSALRVYQQEAPDEDAPPAPPPPGGGSALSAQLLFIGGTVDTFELTNASDRKIFVDAINEGFGSVINGSGYTLSPAYTTIESASSGVSPSQLGYTGTVPSGASTLLLTVSYTTTMPSSMAGSVLGTAAVAQEISDGVSEGGFGSPTVWLASGGLSPPPSPGTPSPPPDASGKGLSTGALVGIIVGGSIGGLVVLFVIYWLCCRRRGKKKGAQKLDGPTTVGKQGPAWQHHASTDTMSGKMSEASEATAALLAANGAAGALAPWTPPAGTTGSLSTATGSAASSRNGAAQAIEWVTRSAAAAAGTPNSRSAPATPTPGMDFKMWALNWSDLEIQKPIGEGSFGRVYLAKWNETFVAVKVLIQRGVDLSDPDEAGRVLSMSNPIMASLHKEAAMMASLRHPNVVGFLGLCTSPPCVASEYCARGSLTDVLRGAARSPAKAAQLDWQRRLNMALDACKGMLYLHSHAPPIIHRDLKSPNLLVDKHWRVKISDFNLSKLLDGESVQSSLAATNPRWLAPEILGRGSATFSSDVYAFGMVLWELLTWELPWAGEGPWQVVALVNEGGRPPVPAREQLPGPDTQDWEGLDGFIDLIRRCWAQNPNDRPTFAEIIPCLRELLEALLTKNQAIGRPQPVVAAEKTPTTSEPTSSQPSATTSAAQRPQTHGVPGL